jgi:D-psicose/D-tagatose/L-ribulose 3-epimerase
VRGDYLADRYLKRQQGKINMKIGANTMIWGVPFTEADLPLIDKVAAMGFGVIELLVDSANPPFDIKAARRRMRDAGLECSISASLSAGHDISSDDAETRNAGIAFVRSVIATADGVGARVIGGPLYSQIGRLKLVPQAAKVAERERSAAALREIAKTAENHGLTIALEAINRFESDFINIAEDMIGFAEGIGSPAIGVHLDTFHMNIEEKDSGRAIRRAGKLLKHFHAAENDKGAPGSGQIRWDVIRDALKDIGYDGFVVIEAFNPDNPELAQFVRIWRRVASSQDELAIDGLKFLSGLLR